MFVLDTDTLIFYFKGLYGVPDRMLAKAPGDVCIPSIVLYELEVGIAKSRAPQKRRAQLDDLLRVTQLLPFDRAEAAASAQVRAALEQNGTPIGPMDTLIAGTALAAGASLVTRNTREFSRIPALQVVNWCDDPLNG
jgi:tRNA(fMet)-specific endonuclease VapC